MGGKIETMEYLDVLDPYLKKGMNVYGDTALTLAARYADQQTVKFLIENYNMGPQEKGAYSRNAFLSAAKGGNIEIMKYLDDLDPDLKNDKDDYGETAPDLAWKSEAKEYLK